LCLAAQYEVSQLSFSFHPLKKRNNEVTPLVGVQGMGGIRAKAWQPERSTSQGTHVSDKVISFPFFPSNFYPTGTLLRTCWIFYSQVVIDGWIFLQVARRIDSTSSSDQGTAGDKSENGTGSDAGGFIVPVDYQLARRKGK
jgi:hypothetical protein